MKLACNKAYFTFFANSQFPLNLISLFFMYTFFCSVTTITSLLMELFVNSCKLAILTRSLCSIWNTFYLYITLCNIHYTVYNIHCTMNIIHYSIQYTLYTNGSYHISIPIRVYFSYIHYYVRNDML